MNTTYALPDHETQKSTKQPYAYPYSDPYPGRETPGEYRKRKRQEVLQDFKRTSREWPQHCGSSMKPRWHDLFNDRITLAFQCAHCDHHLFPLKP